MKISRLGTERPHNMAAWRKSICENNGSSGFKGGAATKCKCRARHSWQMRAHDCFTHSRKTQPFQHSACKYRPGAQIAHIAK
jgi:hypothetical protein